MKVIIDNKRANFNYEFIAKYVAGLELQGSEVKAIKSGDGNVVDAFCNISDNEIFIKNFIVNGKGDFFSHDPNRIKKLLLKKREIKKISNMMDKHLTIVPVKLFFNERNKLKCEIAIAKGKKNYDKRMSARIKTLEKEMKNFI